MGAWNRFCPEIGLEGWHQWEAGGGRERSRKINMVQQCIHMYVNAKMKLFQEWGGDRGEELREEFKYEIFDTL
jgi:hypothetical protein